MTVWVNQAGNGFADPVTIRGTPRAAGASIRLADMAGTGTAGVLWTYDRGAVRGSSYKFLDLTGGTKPYLLSRIDNHAGAATTITYAPSTAYATADRAAGNPWLTTLPFPVHVVASTTVTDYFSQTTLTSEYLYHHGYWDGGDREFRGFARVDQRDTLTSTGPAARYYSPPTETRTWFHPGPVGPENGAWIDGLDLSGDYWPDDPPLTGHVDTSALPVGMNRRGLRFAAPCAARPGAAQRTVRPRRRPQRRPPLPDQRPCLRVRPSSTDARQDPAGRPHPSRYRPADPGPDQCMGTRHRSDDQGYRHRRLRRLRPPPPDRPDRRPPRTRSPRHIPAGAAHT